MSETELEPGSFEYLLGVLAALSYKPPVESFQKREYVSYCQGKYQVPVIG